MNTPDLIDVVAAGVCGADVQRLRAGYAVRSLGHELVGRRPGDGPMAALAAGERVVTAGDLKADHYDVVVESAGGTSSEPILTAATAVAPLGQVVALGVYPRSAAGFLVRTLLEKESTLRGSKAYRVNDDRDDFAAALELLAIEQRERADRHLDPFMVAGRTAVARTRTQEEHAQDRLRERPCHGRRRTPLKRMALCDARIRNPPRRIQRRAHEHPSHCS